MSLPPPPIMVSPPPPAQITSLPEVPEMISAFAVPVMVHTTGAVVSTVQVRLADVASELPAASVALTSKVWEPLLSSS
jgi:hypothetical protein